MYDIVGIKNRRFFENMLFDYFSFDDNTRKLGNLIDLLKYIKNKYATRIRISGEWLDAKEIKIYTNVNWTASIDFRTGIIDLHNVEKHNTKRYSFNETQINKFFDELFGNVPKIYFIKKLLKNKQQYE